MWRQMRCMCVVAISDFTKRVFFGELSFYSTVKPVDNDHPWAPKTVTVVDW